MLEAIRGEVEQWRNPVVTEYARRNATPFMVLIATILSLRTKDACTAEASARLFDLARTPHEMLQLSRDRIAAAIFPVGFYNTKAATILEICRRLIDDYGGEVPDDVDELTKLKGVGRKTANLVVTLGYARPGICVDVHVHRITNRWGYLATRTPDETEQTLRGRLPREYWIPINDWLVAYGQRVCTPVSPWCSKCRVARWCGRVGVARAR